MKSNVLAKPAYQPVKKYPKMLIFLDFETHSLVSPIPTEMTMVAVSTDDLFSSPTRDLPRIKNRLTMCFNPKTKMNVEASKITGLTEKMLANSPRWDTSALKMISEYFNVNVI